MSIDFNNRHCQTITSEKLFGLCDNDNHTPAFISINSVDDYWIAIVQNDNEIPIVFTAIDHCIEILRDCGDMESCCDCMLTYPNNIVFVELKNKHKKWMESGIGQLEKTIEIYSNNHNLSLFSKRRAFVANRKHPNFQVIEVEIKQRIFSKFRVRVMAEATIPIN